MVPGIKWFFFNHSKKLVKLMLIEFFGLVRLMAELRGGNNLLDSNSNIIASINNTANPGQLKIMLAIRGQGTQVTQTMVDNIVKSYYLQYSDTTIVNGGSVGLTYSFNDGISGVSSATVFVADLIFNYKLQLLT